MDQGPSFWAGCGLKGCVRDVRRDGGNESENRVKRKFGQPRLELQSYVSIQTVFGVAKHLPRPRSG